MGKDVIVACDFASAAQREVFDISSPGCYNDIAAGEENARSIRRGEMRQTDAAGNESHQGGD